MTNQAFEKGFAALTATFPNMNFNARLFWMILNDLDGEFFLRAVFDLIKTTKEIYPGTNIIAILRSRAEELRLEILRNSTLQIEAETEKERIERWRKEASPMPDECRVALQELGVKFNIKDL